MAEASDPLNVSFRLLRGDGAPPRPDGSAFRFGIQDRDGQVFAPSVRADGRLMFVFALVAKPGPDPLRPVFAGPFASGSPAERFVYLAWQRTAGAGFVNRTKVRLADLDWAIVNEARARGAPLEADLSGCGTGGGRVPVVWRIGAP